MTPLIREPTQFGAVERGAWENEFADMLEHLFAQGVHDLASIVAALQASRVQPPDGSVWTEATFSSIVARLGA